MKFTAAQTKALQKIADNPGHIVVYTNNAALDPSQRIHGTVSTNLYAQGYIEAFNPETGKSYHDEANGATGPWYSGHYYWRLTDAGIEAIGRKL